jgi:hypothetical protein
MEGKWKGVCPQQWRGGEVGRRGTSVCKEISRSLAKRVAQNKFIPWLFPKVHIKEENFRSFVVFYKSVQAFFVLYYKLFSSFISKRQIMNDCGLPPRCKRDVRSSGILSNVYLNLLTFRDKVSVPPSMIKQYKKIFVACVTLEDGTHSLSQKVGK